MDKENITPVEDNSDAASVMTTTTACTEKDADPETLQPAKKTKPEPDFFNNTKNSGGLQKHFERFRKAKKQDIKYRNYVSK